MSDTSSQPTRGALADVCKDGIGPCDATQSEGSPCPCPDYSVPSAASERMSRGPAVDAHSRRRARHAQPAPLIALEIGLLLSPRVVPTPHSRCGTGEHLAPERSVHSGKWLLTTSNECAFP